jgi:hypothetical protein
VVSGCRGSLIEVCVDVSSAVVFCCYSYVTQLPDATFFPCYKIALQTENAVIKSFISLGVLEDEYEDTVAL